MAVQPTSAPRGPVHPHGCGEHTDSGRAILVVDGSSPRVWGTSVPHREDLELLRFIPTGVGNIALRRFVTLARSVHPHGCGEHNPLVNTSRLGAGSSPRVWGTCRRLRLRLRPSRFIPTGVGNIITRNPDGSEKAVHPHGCGEHASSGLMPRMSNGSSPRVWGTSICMYTVVQGQRFIPTGVGNILPPPEICRTQAVHPHGCGEHDR